MREKQRLNITITANSKKYYGQRPREVSFHNWLARMNAYLFLARNVYPTPKTGEIENYQKITGKTKNWRTWRKRWDNKKF